MIFWIILVCNLLTPLIMSGSGYFMWRHTPKKINSLVGYRTERSMKSAEAWRFANAFCGKLWFFCGLILFALSAAAHIPFYGAEETALGILTAVCLSVQFVSLMALLFPTEIALKRKFNCDGTYKNDIE